MSDLYLRFDSEAQANEYLYTQVPTEFDEDGEPIAWYSQPNFANIDVIGVIYEPQEIVDPENPPEPVPYDGWFVNVRVVAGEDAEPLEPFSIDPQPYPMRVWG
jgi:hypothetical protein